MATADSNSVPSSFSNPHQRQLMLFSLISELCAPRQTLPDTDLCRLVVDSRLPWAVKPIDGGSSWLYLPEPVRMKRQAGVIVLTAD
jgi:hypothetical protein